ncbi:MAG TPA: hypothetical protein VI669_13060 [Vicinamibacteria bacterium]
MREPPVYLRLGKVLDDERLDTLRQRIDDIMLGKRYALSLLGDNGRLRTMREEAERYARSLEAARDPGSD